MSAAEVGGRGVVVGLVVEGDREIHDRRCLGARVVELDVWAQRRGREVWDGHVDLEVLLAILDVYLHGFGDGFERGVVAAADGFHVGGAVVEYVRECFWVRACRLSAGGAVAAA